jgi:hypothetical protein
VRPFEETVVDSDQSSDVSFAQQAFPQAFCGYQVFSRPTAHVQHARIVFAANGPQMKIMSEISWIDSGSKLVHAVDAETAQEQTIRPPPCPPRVSG